jgi:general secretion pathway protein M
LNGRDMALPTPLQDLRAQLRSRWQGLGARERRGAAIAGALLAFFVVWLIAVQPAWRTLRTAPAQRDALDLQLQQMQRLAAEARELRAIPPVAPAQAAAALRAATDALGDRARLTIQGDRATLTLTGVSGDRLVGWLAQARSAARARTVEAQLTRGPQGYSGTITLVLGTAS